MKIIQYNPVLKTIVNFTWFYYTKSIKQNL